eukprot:CAMPEP_0194533104 /NCGR_PEP_ID=MMETSP0253-20130528/70886_1 /TAXON_ID=2966 /ORGANISM="Noctiluca scintillans" /LENGTH=252 /DNA_ID=CAMNT_0039378627 /DNA_START=48 /DNA_END=803 /DNA_ORIENTATION=-
MVPRLIELRQSDYTAVVGPYHDNGLFANVLQVYDLLLFSKPESVVLVDWRRRGGEEHFQYGPPGLDLWTHLFANTDRCRSVSGREEDLAGSVNIPSRINCVFLNMLRGYLWTLPKHDFDHLRKAYAEAGSVLQVSAIIEARLGKVRGPWNTGCYTVGVHKRLDTPEVVACQLSQRMPGSQEFIAKARQLLHAVTCDRRALFLATDDALAVEAFQEAFPPGGPVELFCREVKRTEGGLRADGIDNEVHRSACG